MMITNVSPRETIWHKQSSTFWNCSGTNSEVTHSAKCVNNQWLICFLDVYWLLSFIFSNQASCSCKWIWRCVCVCVCSAVVLKAWLIGMLNWSKSTLKIHLMRLFNQRTQLQWPITKNKTCTGSSQCFRSAWLMSLTWLFCCYKDTQRIKCHVCTEVIYGYAPIITDMKSTCTGFSELSTFSTVKRWKNKRPLGCSTIKAAPSSHAQLCSAENLDFCKSNLLPAWSGLCVYLFMTS